MGIQLIVDSCCDLTEEMRARFDAKTAYLRIIIDDEREYVDDGTVDIPAFIQDMAASKKHIRSACPSPNEYAAFMERSDESIVVTLSSKLSGSYNAAMLARDMVHEHYPKKKIHVIDSKSASAGEVLLAMLIGEKIEAGCTFEEVVEAAEARAAKMETMFVLEDLGNLIRNGRINKVAGLLASVLSLRPVMQANDGEIEAYQKVRGMQKALRLMADAVSERLGDIPERSARLVMAFCNCPDRAVKFKQDLLDTCKQLKEVIVIPTAALSTMYANNGGVIIAF